MRSIKSRCFCCCDAGLGSIASCAARKDEGADAAAGAALGCGASPSESLPLPLLPYDTSPAMARINVITVLLHGTVNNTVLVLKL